MLRTYRIFNPMVEFSKYEFNNKLLDYVTLFIYMLGRETPWRDSLNSYYNI